MKKIALEFGNLLVLRTISMPALVTISVVIGMLAAALIPVSVR